MPRPALAALAGCLWLSASPAGAAPTAAEMAQRAIDGFIRPGYSTLRDSAATLHSAVDALCAAPSEPALDTAREKFADAVRAWSSIEIIRFGPVTEGNRLERLLFWPDRKGTGLRQVQAILAGKDTTAADPATLAGKSVAAQGFGALEFVLYGAGAETLTGGGEPFRCAYGAAIAGNIEDISAGLLADWNRADGFAAAWTSPGPANPLYRDQNETLSELVEIFVNGLELVRDVRIGGFLADEPKADRPRQALFWRSGLTADTLAANMAGMQALLDASGLAEALPADQAWIAESADFEFGNALRAAEAARGPIDAVLADPGKRGKLSYLALVTSSLSDIFGTRLSGAFGLSAGFSSLDGD